MTHFEQITRSPEALATFLGLLPVLSSPWEEAFQKAFCSDCKLAECDSCPHPSERINPLWWLRREAAEVATTRGTKKRVLDVACGSKMFWFDKHNADVEYCDNREIEYHEFYPNRYIEIKPDTVCDFTALPFESGSYKLVVFDPPHLTRAGDTSWTALKYGKLSGEWRDMLRRGFEECFRVLDGDGVLVFKWSEVQIPLKEILPLSPYPPLFGNRSGKNNNTHWLCFMKPRKVAT